MVIFILIFERTIVALEISVLDFVKTQKFVQNKTMPKSLIRVILSCKFEKLLSDLKSVPSNLLKWKVLCKNKNP